MQSERAYVAAHAAVICPTCAGLLANTEGPIFNQELQPVTCRNPNCPDAGLVKVYARPFVELKDADPS